MSSESNTATNGYVPEVHYLPPTDYVPNSPLPYLVYRNVLPMPVTEESCKAFIERNGWVKTGPVWPATAKRHFHPNVHECYGILSGRSEVLMGVGTGDGQASPDDTTSSHSPPGLRLVLQAGDVVVHPAGTAHSNVATEGDYKYLAFFPEGSPQWKSENGSKILDLSAVRKQTLAVPVPQDPVFGGDGQLGTLWEEGQLQFDSGLRP